MFRFGSNLSVTDNKQTTNNNRQTNMKNLRPLHHRPQRGNYFEASKMSIITTGRASISVGASPCEIAIFTKINVNSFVIIFTGLALVGQGQESPPCNWINTKRNML